jgi:DivIVA domain-containing protein
MKLWKKDTESNADAALRGTGARVTPLDVQEKKFRRSSRPSGGYVMREVDEFLDDVTDTLSALIAENERLRRAAAGAPADRSAASVPMQGEGDRAAVDAFLRREKGFLQDLGGLVQAHAEELKAMVRAARAESAPAAEDSAAAEPAEPAAAPAAIVAQEEPTPPEVADDEPHAAPPPSPQEADGADATATETGVVAEEPIRLEEPEPARSRRADEQDRSLRELFWGEE